MATGTVENHRNAIDIRMEAPIVNARLPSRNGLTAKPCHSTFPGPVAGLSGAIFGGHLPAQPFSAYCKADWGYRSV